MCTLLRRVHIHASAYTGYDLPAIFSCWARDKVGRGSSKRDETRRGKARQSERKTFDETRLDGTRRGEARRGAADTRASSEWEVRCGEILSYDVDTRPLNLTLSVYRVSSSEAVATLVTCSIASWENDGKKPRSGCTKLFL